MPGTLQCPHCGFVLAPAAVAAASTSGTSSGAPGWPYPDGLPRALPAFNTVFGAIFIGTAIFVCAVLGVVFVAIGPAIHVLPTAAIVVWFLLPLVFLAIGVGTIRAGRRERADAERLWSRGRRCWGQVRSSAPAGVSRRQGGRRWTKLHLELDAYPVEPPTGGEPLRIACAWYIAEMQLVMTLPGAWVALLVDDADPKIVRLEALRSPTGAVVPLQ